MADIQLQYSLLSNSNEDLSWKVNSFVLSILSSPARYGHSSTQSIAWGREDVKKLWIDQVAINLNLDFLPHCQRL